MLKMPPVVRSGVDLEDDDAEVRLTALAVPYVTFEAGEPGTRCAVSHHRVIALELVVVAVHPVAVGKSVPRFAR